MASSRPELKKAGREDEDLPADLRESMESHVRSFPGQRGKDLDSSYAAYQPVNFETLRRLRTQNTTRYRKWDRMTDRINRGGAPPQFVVAASLTPAPARPPAEEPLTIDPDTETGDRSSEPPLPDFSEQVEPTTPDAEKVPLGSATGTNAVEIERNPRSSGTEQRTPQDPTRAGGMSSAGVGPSHAVDASVTPTPPAAKAVYDPGTAPTERTTGSTGQADPLLVVAGPSRRGWRKWGVNWPAIIGICAILTLFILLIPYLAPYLPHSTAPSGLTHVKGPGIIAYPIIFSETGSPSGARWSVTLNGTTVNSTTTMAEFNLSNGTYGYEIAPPLGYTSNSTPGQIVVSGAAIVKSFSFNKNPPAFYKVIFEESGLTTGTKWRLALNGTPFTSTGRSMSFNLTNGTYSFEVGSLAFYQTFPGNGNLTVSGKPVNQTISYSAGSARVWPIIASVQVSGGSGAYSLTINGTGFGTLGGSLPCVCTTTDLRVAVLAELGSGEWGFSGDSNRLDYESWANSSVIVGALNASPGDALALTVWNPATGLGASWGGNIPGGPPNTPRIDSVGVSGFGGNLTLDIQGSGFGPAPTSMPFTGDLKDFMFSDFRDHCGGGSGSFAAGSAGWMPSTSTPVTLDYSAWTNTSIQIKGFSGAYGGGCTSVRHGDPILLLLWNSSDTNFTQGQTAWGGFLPPNPVISSVWVSGTPGSFSFTINGTNFGPAPGSFPCTCNTGDFRIADVARPRSEAGYGSDMDLLKYVSWSFDQIVVTGFNASPGDGIAIALWNVSSELGATWGGIALPSNASQPIIDSVFFSGAGPNLSLILRGIDFGPAPTSLPYEGDLKYFMLTDFRDHCGGGSGSFGAGDIAWSNGATTLVTLKYEQWNDTTIVVGGFGGSYGGSCVSADPGDPILIFVWSGSDTGQSQTQAVWAGSIPYP